MSDLLWKKDDTKVDARIQRFLAGADVALDRHLLPHDIAATAAHVAGLARIGMLTGDESSRVRAALDELAAIFSGGTFVLDDRYEDGHSAIEAFLVERLGELGKKVHLGRSRNDQVLVATRLWLRETLGAVRTGAVTAAAACLELARRDATTPMPGYTHLQRAVPSSVGLWMGAYAEGFIDAAELVGLTTGWLDACPLGTAAGYGVNLPLDREGVAHELGFGRIQVNPMHAQNTRGAHEVQALAACWQVAQAIRRLAWDLSLFTTSEFAFVRLSAEATTGSSIMPNKRNPDLVEVLRGVAGVVAGAITELTGLVSVPGGYQRDLQLTKGPVIRAVTMTRDAIELVAPLVRGIELDRERMRAAIDGPMHATDRAVELAAGGVPFRDAYRQVAREQEALAARTPEASVAARVSAGGCANLMLEALAERLGAMA